METVAQRKAEARAARRAKMKALMSRSRQLAAERHDGMFTRSKCFYVCGTEAALQNHVSAHRLEEPRVCAFCGESTDVETQRARRVKHVSIDHTENAVVVEYERLPIEIGHVCNERIMKRPVDNEGYRRSTKS